MIESISVPSTNDFLASSSKSRCLRSPERMTLRCAREDGKRERKTKRRNARQSCRVFPFYMPGPTSSLLPLPILLLSSLLLLLLLLPLVLPLILLLLLLLLRPRSTPRTAPRTSRSPTRTSLTSTLTTRGPLLLGHIPNAPIEIGHLERCISPGRNPDLPDVVISGSLCNETTGTSMAMTALCFRIVVIYGLIPIVSLVIVGAKSARRGRIMLIEGAGNSLGRVCGAVVRVLLALREVYP